MPAARHARAPLLCVASADCASLPLCVCFPCATDDVIGQALLDTLALGLGDAFTPALKAAWAEIYGIVSTTMIGDTFAYPAAAIKLGRYTKPADEKQAAAVTESQKSAMSWWTTSGNNLGG